MSTRLRQVVQLLIVLAIIVVIAGTLSLIIYWERAAAAGPQPIPFPHVKMVGAGVPCLFCHSGATKSPAAGIPSVERCLGCHRIIATDSPLIGKLFAYYGKTIPWVRINRLPRFVHFRMKRTSTTTLPASAAMAT